MKEKIEKLESDLLREILEDFEQRIKDLEREVNNLL